MENRNVVNYISSKVIKIIDGLKKQNCFVNYGDSLELLKVSHVVLLSNGLFGAILDINKVFTINELVVRPNDTVFLSSKVIGGTIKDKDFTHLIYNESRNSIDNTIFAIWDIFNNESKIYVTEDKIIESIGYDSLSITNTPEKNIIKNEEVIVDTKINTFEIRESSVKLKFKDLVKTFKDGYEKYLTVSSTLTQDRLEAVEDDLLTYADIILETNKFLRGLNETQSNRDNINDEYEYIMKLRILFNPALYLEYFYKYITGEYSIIREI